MKKGVFVGTFNQEELAMGLDKKAVAKKREETGLEYNNTEFVMKNGEIVGLKIWVCSLDDCELWNGKHIFM